MLTEAFLATLVIAACAAGIGLGIQHSIRPIHAALSIPNPYMMSRAFLPRQDEGVYVIGVFQHVSNPALAEGMSPDFNNPYFIQVDWVEGELHSWGMRGRYDLHTSAKNSAIEEFERRYSDRLIALMNTPDGDETQTVVRAHHPESLKRIDLEDGSFLVSPDGQRMEIRGRLAFNKQYESWGSAQGLANTVGAFVEGAANFIKSMGVSGAVAVALMGVLVASFAGTTMDTACRLQRYVIQELARTFLPRPPSSACHRCGYDLKGLEKRNSNGAVVLAEGQGHDSAPSDTQRVALPKIGQDHGAAEVHHHGAIENEPTSITCPECGAVNRWHLDTASHPDERAPETFGWDAIEKHASPFNPFWCPLQSRRWHSRCGSLSKSRCARRHRDVV
jgi:hypothetical protein